MEGILRQMFQVQDELNKVAISASWREAGCDWNLAVSQECAEGIDHLGYKWWAKQAPDVAAAQMEAVDIMHFALSAHMHACPDRSHAELAAALTPPCLAVYDDVFHVKVDELNYWPCRMKPSKLFTLISVLAGSQRGDYFELVPLLAERLGLPFSEFSRLYRVKAILNLVRQENGYKDGSYKKLWWGKEDNETAAALGQLINWELDIAPLAFKEVLERTYRDALRQRPEPIITRVEA